MSTVLNRRIDPSAPLADASFILMAAYGIANQRLPHVPKNTSRRTRSFNRGPDMSASNRTRTLAPSRPERLTVAGATRFYGRSIEREFSARARMPEPANTRAASSLLMATGRRSVFTPRATILDIAGHRAAAMRKIGALRYRFNDNVADMRDGVANTPRMRAAYARYARPGFEI